MKTIKRIWGLVKVYRDTTMPLLRARYRTYKLTRTQYAWAKDVVTSQTKQDFLEYNQKFFTSLWGIIIGKRLGEVVYMGQYV